MSGRFLRRIDKSVDLTHHHAEQQAEQIMQVSIDLPIVPKEGAEGQS